MLRFGLLFALLSLLTVSVSSVAAYDDDSFNSTISARPNALGAGYKSAGWTRRSPSAGAQWEPRAGGVVEWYTGKMWTGRGYTNAPAGGGWLLMYGAGAWTCWDDCVAKEEVWYSGNKGQTWAQLEPSAPFSPLLSPQTVQDHNGYQYRIQGTDAEHGCNGNPAFSDVFVSMDGGRVWNQKNDFPGEGTRFLGTAVVDSQNAIYLIMGQDCNDMLNDVWVSRDGASKWSRVNPRNTRGPAGRSVHGSVVGKYTDPSSKAQIDAIYVMFGYRGADQSGNLYRNDIWVSTNGASSWLQITEKAQWTARGDSQLEITSKGVLVIAGGVSNVEGTERRQLNDVWASLDGGWTWGICSDNAKWDDRVFQYTAIDSDGLLYVMGGFAIDADGNNRLVNDVWVSSQSFDDPAAVADMCGLIVPPCGVGLKCLPSDNVVQGNWGVSCDACQWSPLSTPAAASSSMTMTYLFVAFLLATIALAAALAYLVYRMKQSGAGAPIPLPASAQRWWNDKPAGGLTDELNKGNTASDTMYNPLTIRDQM